MAPPDTETVYERFDVVYFLMFAGWSSELRSNRWHFARRWARRLPVVLVQPTQARPKWPTGAQPLEEPEPRIPNCSILHVLETGQPFSTARAAVQLAQVADHMRLHGYVRPLLWCYNPLLLGVYSATPAAARVYHATENYADFDLPPDWLQAWRAAIGISDVVVSVSAGVTHSVRPHAVGRFVESANGCDYSAYADAAPDPDLRAAGSGFERIAVYAGNVNARVDPALIGAAAARHPTTLFALYGPVNLGPDDAALWEAALASPNVRHYGAVDPDRLPALYHAADVGFIPYRNAAVIVDNGFPLKLLEMGAAGLPVVSTHMKPIEGLARALVVTHGRDEFVAALGRTDRARLDPEAAQELARVCRASDYDTRFEAIVSELASGPLAEDPTTRADAFATATFGKLDLLTWRGELLSILLAPGGGRLQIWQSGVSIRSALGATLPTPVLRALRPVVRRIDRLLGRRRDP